MRARGKFQAAIALRNDHAEETFFTDEPPDFGWEIVKFVGDFPIVDHGAQLLRWPIKKRLLFGAEGGLRIAQKFVPIWPAGEQFAVPPHGAGFQRLSLGLRNRGEQRFIPTE